MYNNKLYVLDYTDYGLIPRRDSMKRSLSLPERTGQDTGRHWRGCVGVIDPYPYYLHTR